MSTTGHPEEIATPALQKRIMEMMFQALQTKLAARIQARLVGVLDKLEALDMQMTSWERERHGSGPRPSINLPEKYDGVSKNLVDQFISQVEATAEFERFCDDRQKILWAQLYLTALALTWSRVITTGFEDPDLNPRHFVWTAWLVDFKAAFGLRDPVQDALNCIGVLQQGLRSIMEYCMVFFELKGRLGPSNANSEYVKDRFWKGLSTAAMEALVNTDFAMAKEAHNVLLRHESKLADIAAWRKGQWHGLHLKAAAMVPVAGSAMATARSAPPPALRDPDAMDVDRAQEGATKKCSKCGKTGHFIAECLVWMASLKVEVH
ncbi:hypothetical protein C0993_009344 [Termitomyces sp. T159_Od127]|nr:hypothetical protein C0993_009344 [Termitomyces sp. T159_Od127]